MKKGVLLLIPLIFLSGCALPLPIKVASWALDGISYLATKKSIAENGLSIIAKKDCSLMRPLKGEQVCIGDGYDIAQVLKNAVVSVSADDQGDQVGATAEFETAAGPAPDERSYDAAEFSDAWQFIKEQAKAEETLKEAERSLKTEFLASIIPPRKPVFRGTVTVAAKAAAAAFDAAFDAPGYNAGENTEAWAFIQARHTTPALAGTGAVAEEKPEPAFEPAASPELGGGPYEMSQDEPEMAEIPAQAPEYKAPEYKAPEAGPETGYEIQPNAGLYFVIGSLTRLVDMDRLTSRQTDLKSRIVVARLDDRNLYREVVGPFKRSEKQAVRRMIEESGVSNAWLTYIDPHTWTLASPAEISALPFDKAQTASLN